MPVLRTTALRCVRKVLCRVVKLEINTIALKIPQTYKESPYSSQPLTPRLEFKTARLNSSVPPDRRSGPLQALMSALLACSLCSH